MPKKYALAPCNGMSPNGLVSRVATGDCKKENENVPRSNICNIQGNFCNC